MRRGARGTAAVRRLPAVLAGLALALVSPAAHAGPAADMSAPAVIDAGLDLLLNGSASREPPLTYVWTLESVRPMSVPTTAVEAVLAAASSANADTVVLPAESLRPGGIYDIRLTVTDPALDSDFVTHSVEVLPAAAPALGPLGRALLALALCLVVLLRPRLLRAFAA